MNSKEAWRDKNKQHIKEYNRQYWQKWYERNQQKRSMQNAKWRIDNKEYFKKYDSNYMLSEIHHTKKLARLKFANKIQSGKIIRQTCSIKECNQIGQGHHPNYSKPLEVIWLCKKHHSALHKFLRKPV